MKAHGSKCEMHVLIPPKNNNTDKRCRAHLVQDIIPYTCIIDPCDTPDEMYLTAESLVAHTLKSHSTSRWTCDYCAFETPGSRDSTSHQSLVFETAKDWEKHFIQNHKEKLTTSNITMLAELNKQQMFPALSCPLCQEFNVDTKIMDFKIDDHILRHLHEFSIMSLPGSSQQAGHTTGSTSQASVLLSHTGLIDYTSAPALGSLNVEITTKQLQAAIAQVWSLLAPEKPQEIPCIVDKPHAPNSTQAEIWKTRAGRLMGFLDAIIDTPHDASSCEQNQRHCGHTDIRNWKESRKEVKLKVEELNLTGLYTLDNSLDRCESRTILAVYWRFGHDLTIECSRYEPRHADTISVCANLAKRSCQRT